jgi:hypothetical protein
MTRVLLKAGAKAGITAKDGRHAADIAEARGRASIAALLKTAH